MPRLRSLLCGASVAALVVGLSLVPGAGFVGVSPAAAQAFSTAERARLERGDLVVRREARQRGRMRLIGGTSYQVIDEAPELVWRAVLDAPRYRHFLPQAVESRVIQRTDSGRLIRVRHEHGLIDASYYVNARYDVSRKTIEFRIDTTRPGDIQEGWGFFTVTRFGSRSMVTFGVFADVGGGVLAGIVRPQVHEWMMRIPELLETYLESGGRNHYLR
jgi:ribosome-associated toxin RatA of RatAB toxin-antitoxin module